MTLASGLWESSVNGLRSCSWGPWSLGLASRSTGAGETPSGLAGEQATRSTAAHAQASKHRDV